MAVRVVVRSPLYRINVFFKPSVTSDASANTAMGRPPVWAEKSPMCVALPNCYPSLGASHVRFTVPLVIEPLAAASMSAFSRL